MEKKTELKPVKKSITDKQKAARMANLERGRKKRMESIKQKKEGTDKPEEYDLSSNEENDSSSDDDDTFIISKKKPVAVKKNKPVVDENANLKSEVDELKNMVIELASLQKKQHKVNKKNNSRQNGSTKIVVLPNNANSGNSETKSANDSLMDALRRSLL
jgi:hypothetical protein